MNPKIFCLVLNYQHFLDSGKCLTNLRRSDLPTGVEFLIMDNSPDDSSYRYFRKVFPKIKVLRNSGNFGFAKGNNVGVRYALKHGASHVLIINPDVTVGRRFLKPLLSGLDKDRKAAIIAPAIQHKQNGVIFYGMQGKIDWVTGKATHTNFRRLPKKRGVVRSQFVTFACALIKTEVFGKIGLLDERYFMYLEDVDYCLSTREAGFKVLLDPGVVVGHLTSSSFRKPTDKLLISFRSQITFINKWLKFPKNIFPIVYTLFFYPYLFLLWTYHDCKARFFSYFLKR